MVSRASIIPSAIAIFFGVGYYFLVYGFSIILAQWGTNRMLVGQYDSLREFITTNSPNLVESISKLNETATQISIFNALGIIIILGSGFMVGMILASSSIRRSINIDRINWEQLAPSNNSLTVIASTLFAVSLIFFTVGDQSRTQTEQMITSSILTVNENHDKIKIVNDIISKTIDDNSYAYYQNMWHAAFTGQLALTFLLITAIRSTKTQFAAILDRYLLVACIIAFSLWVVYSIQSIGISGVIADPSTIPIIPKPFG